MLNFLETDRESKRLYESLFVGLSLAEGKSLSKAERRRKGLMDDRALIYGEVSGLCRQKSQNHGTMHQTNCTRIYEALFGRVTTVLC